MSASARRPAVDTPADRVTGPAVGATTHTVAADRLPAAAVPLLDVLARRETAAVAHRPVTAGGQRREPVR